jgi:hypothetical protein
MYKIPGRMIVCDTIGGWLKEMLWIYVIMKIFVEDINAITCKCSEKSLN